MLLPNRLGAQYVPSLWVLTSEKFCRLLRYAFTIFDLIVDIGSAEGYYTVGFAMALKGAINRVITYDTNKWAQALCAKNASVNNVSIEIKGFCDSQTLIDSCSNKKALIFVDAKDMNRVIDNNLTNCFVIALS